MCPPQTVSATQQRRAILAIGLAFIMSGTAMASWFARIPAAKAYFGVGDGYMGFLLVFFAIGSLLAMPLTGTILARFGGKRIVCLAELGMCLALILPGMAPTLSLLALSLLLLGAAHGFLDVAMNSIASCIEQVDHRSLMPMLHALFSLGGLIGAGLGAILTYADVSMHWHLTGIAVFFAVVAMLSWPALPRDQDANGLAPATGSAGPLLAWPGRHLAGLAMIAFCATMAEGVTNDWSALFMHQSLGTSESFAPLGFAVFSIAMVLGRLAGGTLSARLGTSPFVLASGLLTLLGAAISVMAPNGWIALPGFTILGFGVAAIFPLVLSQAGRQSRSNAAIAIAAVSTAGYTGLLAGPVVIGGLAGLFTLRLALGVLMLLGLGIVWLCWRHRAMENT